MASAPPTASVPPLRRRVRRETVPEQVAVSLAPAQGDATQFAHIIRELVKLLLYLRQQLPGCYDDMHAQLEELAEEEAEQQQLTGVAGRRRRRRATPEEKRASKVLASVDALCEAASPAVLADYEVQSVVLLLGTSAARPREAIELVVPPSCRALGAAACDEAAGAGGEGDAGVARRRADATRRVLRALVLSMAAEAPSVAATKLYLLLRVAEPAASAAPPAGFVTKRALRPAFGRARLLRRVVLQGGSGGGGGEGAMAAGDGVWWQCKAVVRGWYTAPPGAENDD